MKIHIVTVGAPQLSFAQGGFAEYIKRLGRFHKVHVTHLKDDARAEEKMKAAMQQTYAVLLDEHGTQFTSQSLAKKLASFALHGQSNLTFCIGGPEGHSDDVKAHAQYLWSLSSLTLPHDLAMLFTAEALYRASTIIAGHPYHRA